MTATSETRPVSVGLIGAGAIARAHAIAYSMAHSYSGNAVPPVRLRMVAEATEDRAREAAAALGFETWTADWQELVASPDVDIVSIVAPNYLHADMAIAAAAAGKHVFCEKPLAASAEAAGKMWQAARSAGVVHGVNFNYRKVPALRFITRIIAEGRIGEVRHYRAAYLQDWATDARIPRSWKFDAKLSGGGAVSGVGSHVIDLARAFVGEIESVSSANRTWIAKRPLPASASTFDRVEATAAMAPVDNDDSAFFIARFAGGAIGSFDISRSAHGRKNHMTLEIHGSKGSIAYDYEQPNEVRLYLGEDDPAVGGFRTILIGPAQDTGALLAYPGVPVGFAETIVFQMRDFLAAVAGGPAMQPDFFDGWRAQAVVDAVVASSGKGWVDVPPPSHAGTAKAS